MIINLRNLQGERLSLSSNHSGRSIRSRSTPSEKLRLDKWLWAARFYKTRALATDAVDCGKVKLNGQRTKPAHAIKIGDTLDIVIGEYTWLIHVLALSDKREAAPTAQQTLYREYAASHAQRQAQIAEHKILGQAHPVKAPDKKDRREIAKLKQTGWESVF
jgi:ribosome-associated heat shock protein Hsp15